jgi:hypothetical protein
MKTRISTSFLFVAMLMLTLGACKDRNAEKRIAELESELQKVKGQQAPQPVPAAAEGVQAPEAKPDGPLPEFQFETIKHDFGTLKEGDPAEYTYSFKNSGAVPLVISAVRPSCGCTVPEHSKEPIPVGGTGFVKVKFDTNGKSNVQNKTVTVIANTFPKETILSFTALIVPKADKAK